MGLLSKVELLHALYFVADGFQVAGAAVGGHAFQNFGQGQRDVFRALCQCLQAPVVRVGGGDKNQPDGHHVGVLPVTADKGAAYGLKADALSQCRFTDPHLFPVGLGGGAHHVASGENVVLHKVDILNGAEGLFRIVRIVALNVAHLNQRNSGKACVGFQLAQIGTVHQNLVTGHQRRVGGNAGEADAWLAAAAQLICRVPEHDEFKIPGFCPTGVGAAGKAPGNGGAQMIRNGADDGIV